MKYLMMTALLALIAVPALTPNVAEAKRVKYTCSVPDSLNPQNVYCVPAGPRP